MNIIRIKDMAGVTKFQLSSSVVSGLSGQLDLTTMAPTLQVLTGVRIGLTGVTALSSCTALQQCYLSENTFTGTVYQLPDTTTLQTVKFMNNRFTGFGANYFTANLNGLKLFDISNNTLLTGNFPDVTNLTSINTLQARSCNLTGALPIPVYTGITAYGFDGNKFTGNAINIATYSGGFVTDPGVGIYNKNFLIANNELTGYVTGTNGQWPKSGNKISYDASTNSLAFTAISGLLRAAYLGSGTGHSIKLGGGSNAKLTGVQAVALTGAGGLIPLLSGRQCTVLYST
jgi:hypothetical protein